MIFFVSQIQMMTSYRIPYTFGKFQVINLTNSQSTQNFTFVQNQDYKLNMTPWKPENQIGLTFFKCQPYLIHDNQTCASDEVMQKFFNIPQKTITVTIFFNEYDKDRSVLVSRPKAYYFILDDTQSIFTQIVLRTKNLIVSRGYLFQTDKIYNYFYSVEVQTQTVSQSEMLKTYGSQAYAQFLVRLDSVQELEQISFPTLGEVGAQVGSIINMIFCMKLLITLYNENRFQKKLMGVIISTEQSKTTNSPVDDVDQAKLFKKSALKKTNIFNVHIELSKMRALLDEIVAKNCDENHEMVRLIRQNQQESDHQNFIQQQNKHSQNPPDDGIGDSQQIPIFSYPQTFYDKSDLNQIKAPDKLSKPDNSNLQNSNSSKFDTQKPKIIASQKIKLNQNQQNDIELIINSDHQNKYQIYYHDE